MRLAVLLLGLLLTLPGSLAARAPAPGVPSLGVPGLVERTSRPTTGSPPCQSPTGWC